MESLDGNEGIEFDEDIKRHIEVINSFKPQVLYIKNSTFHLAYIRNACLHDYVEKGTRFMRK